MSKHEPEFVLDSCMNNEQLVAELSKHRQNEVKVLVGTEHVPIVGVSYQSVGDMIVIHLNPLWTMPLGPPEEEGA